MIALQYGGSQLVNRITTYRKTGAWTSNSRDILNTVTRYYSNSFTDNDKQMAINLFLGKFVPSTSSRDLWTLDSDHYLHFQPIEAPTAAPRPDFIHWWKADLDQADIERFEHGACEPLSPTLLRKLRESWANSRVEHV